jgi:DNA-binding MarR family transcriptional regulator
MKDQIKIKANEDPDQERNEQSGRYAYEGLDRIMHEKARLGILTSLATHRDGLLFNQLKELCSLSDGNLSRHIQALEEAGLVEVWKGFHKKRPQTLCRLTPIGVLRFQEYLRELEKVIRDAAEAQKESAANVVKNSKDIAQSDGWVPA